MHRAVLVILVLLQQWISNVINNTMSLKIEVGVTMMFRNLLVKERVMKV